MVYDPLGIYPKKKKKRKPVSRGSLRDLYARAGGECERCGESLRGLKGHIHHKNRNKSDNRLSNLLLLCPTCHSRAHKNDKLKPTGGGGIWINPITGRREKRPKLWG